MLAVITAPDGQGKTIYSEVLAEHWAKHKNRVVFRPLRTQSQTDGCCAAWHAIPSITVRDLKAGILPPESVNRIAAVRLAWHRGMAIFPVHTPGWSMERTCAELHRLHADGECDVIVLDYQEKAQSPKAGQVAHGLVSA